MPRPRKLGTKLVANPDLRPCRRAGVDRGDAARIVAPRRRRRSDQRRGQSPDAHLSPRLPRGGGRTRRSRLPGPRADRTGDRHLRRGGRDAAPGRSGAAAVRARHADHRGGIFAFRRRLGRPAAGARARGERWPARLCRAAVSSTSSGSCTGWWRRSRATSRAPRRCCEAWSWRSSRSRSRAPSRSSISRSCSSSGRSTSSRRACDGWPRASSPSGCRWNRATSSACSPVASTTWRSTCRSRTGRSRDAWPRRRARSRSRTAGSPRSTR